MNLYKQSDRKLKIDLHTHCFEALHISLAKRITPSAVEQIVSSVLSKGLDGIAITEHYDREAGDEAKRIVSQDLTIEL